MVELIGVIASIVVVISFFMNGEKRIRKTNIVGSFIFALYGFLITSISILFLNIVSVIVNIIKIYKLNEEEIKK